MTVDLSAIGRHELEGYARTFLEERHARLEREMIYVAARRHWGSDAQLRMVQEECAELIAAINRFTRGRVQFHDLAGEIADVGIMFEQARLIVGVQEVDSAQAEKIKRLATRIGTTPPGQEGA